MLGNSYWRGPDRDYCFLQADLDADFLLMAGHLHGNVPLVDSIGDVTGVHFPGEDEVVLFVPGSGDVLRCSAQQWQGLRADSSLHADEAGAPEPPPENPNAELRTILRQLGTLVA